MTRIWIDVEDLFEYAAANPRPSGIQRLAFEIYLALDRRFGADGPVRFVRHGTGGRGFVTVPWDRVRSLFDGLVAERPARAPDLTPVPGKPGMLSLDSPLHVWRRRVTHRLPMPVRVALVQLAQAQLEAFRAFARLIRAITGRFARRPQHVEAVDEVRDEDIAPLVARGDVLLVAGAPWSHPRYGELIARMRGEHGMRFALLVYDIIPLRRPEWCDRSLTRLFKTWFDDVLPQCDRIFAISHASARDLERYADATGLAIPLPVRAIPIGTGFSGDAPAATALRPDLPAPGSYVLFVSTIEARKNHSLLVRVWRHLLEQLPREQVPTLVFAGRAGWLVADLLQQLANSQWLGGAIRHVHDPSDAELHALYRGCLFTVFPSLYEGWGLPVTESLAFGKPCVISNAASLPEAGGALARYFDPENVADATRVIREVIEDRAGLAAWEMRVAAEFRPVSWDATGAALVAGVAPELLGSGLEPASLV